MPALRGGSREQEAPAQTKSRNHNTTQSQPPCTGKQPRTLTAQRSGCFFRGGGRNDYFAEEKQQPHPLTEQKTTDFV